MIDCTEIFLENARLGGTPKTQIKRLNDWVNSKIKQPTNTDITYPVTVKYVFV